MVHYDLNKVYEGESKQNVRLKKYLRYGQIKDGQDNKDKYIDTRRKILSEEMIICIVEALIFIFYRYYYCTFLIGQKVMYQKKNLTCVTKSIHVKYQSSSTHC